MTTISNSMSTATDGIRRNVDSLEDVARQVASPSVDDASAGAQATAVVQAIEYSNAIEAAADAVRASNESIGELLDVLV